MVVTGLTAAGKTTHAKILAEELSYRYVSGTGALARLCGIEVSEDPPRWAEIAEAVARVRTDNVDLALERHLLDLAKSRDGQVFDVWALAWTSPSPMVRVWIESDQWSRQMKCFVSQGAQKKLSLEECGSFVQQKDLENRELFRRTLNFDLFTDRSPFDLTIDNSSYIAEPTEQAAQRGIAAFAPQFNLAVKRLLSG